MAAEAPLARTRLLPPRIHRGWMERARLLDLLDWAENVPATLVVAPPGFGKTGLVAQWAARHRGQVAWLTLDPRDDSLIPFTTMLGNAVNAVVPGAVISPLRYFDFAGERPDPAVVATHLLNDLADLSADLAIVLDDAHVIADPRANAVIEALATAQIPGLRLILCSRTDPPWSLAKLRASGRLAEIRASDLRLAADEVAAYARHAGWDAISRDDSETIARVSRGWLTAVRFLCASPQRVRGQAAAEGMAGGIDAGLGADAMGWLLADALASLPATDRDLLLRLAVPDQVNRALAEALGAGVCSPEERRAIYDRLVDDGLFLSRPDENRWSTLHAEVRQAMLARLEAEAGADAMRWLHGVARDWFLARGLHDDAVRHAFLAGGPEEAARVVRAAMRQTLAAERWRDLERWLAMLPADLVRDDPELLLAKAWIARAVEDIPGAQGLLDAASARLAADTGMAPDERAQLAAEIDVLRGAIAYFTGDPATGKRLCSAAIATLAPERTYSLALAYLFLVLSCHTLDPETTPEEIAGIVASAAMLPAVVNVHAWTAAGCVTFQQGDLRRLIRLTDRMRALGDAHHSVLISSWAEAFTAIATYQLNDLDGAIANATALLERASRLHRVAVREALICLALAYEAKGQPADADLTLDRLEELILTEGVLVDLPGLEALRARIALRRGDAAAARAWYGEPGEPDAVHSSHSVIDERVERAAVAVELGIDLERTVANLDRYLASRTMVDTLTHRLDLLALRARAAWQLGDPEAAASGIAQALREVEPFGQTRVFLDRGPGLLPLLDLIPPSSPLAEEAARLRAGIAAEAPPRARPQSRQQPDGASPAKPLSERELEVLELLAQRLTNKEIGVELRISPLTVKRHTINIYAKLGVASRRQAIQFARDAGLVPVPDIEPRPARPLAPTGTA